MSVLPPPAATLARVAPAVRFAVKPGGAATAHVLAATVTRCGHKTAAGWQALTAAEAPPVRLCARCTAGLPARVRTELVPTPAELATVVEREARQLAEDLRRRLAELRTEALVDGSAYERTRLVHAARAPRLTVPRGAKPLTRAERDAHVSGYVATARELTLLELLNHLDPSRPTAPGWRSWFVDEPELGTPVATGGEYDARLWMGRKR